MNILAPRIQIKKTGENMVLLFGFFKLSNGKTSEKQGTDPDFSSKKRSIPFNGVKIGVCPLFLWLHLFT
jgi:hypothetical protein